MVTRIENSADSLDIDSLHHRERLVIARDKPASGMELLGKEIAHSIVAVVDDNFFSARFQRAFDRRVDFHGHPQPGAVIFRLVRGR
jgi:hypothetical protein